MRDTVLRDLAWMMIGDNIRLIPRRTFSRQEMRAWHEVVNGTKARVYSWASSLLGALTLVVAVAAMMSTMSWTSTIAVIFVAAAVAFAASYPLFPLSLVKAARASPDAFFQLWQSGALRIEVRGEQYDAFEEPNRWQDIVLLAAGWRDLMTDQPVSRGQRLAEALGVAQR